MADLLQKRYIEECHIITNLFLDSKILNEQRKKSLPNEQYNILISLNNKIKNIQNHLENVLLYESETIGTRSELYQSHLTSLNMLKKLLSEIQVEINTYLISNMYI
jgi:delta-aminolevulinic acid dehydratase/porphobilinogen synthase